MKKKAILLSILLLALPVSSLSFVSANPSSQQTELVSPGEITGLFCSDPHPTLGEPVYLVITIQGKANEQFNETVVVTDEFSGFVMSAGDMIWISGNNRESQHTITIGKLTTYTKKIPWYPSIVGNHTLHVTAGTFLEKHLNVSVSFDVEGIIAPSLGCPSIITKNDTHQLQITISEGRNLTDEPAQILEVELQDVYDATVYRLENQTMTYQTWVMTGSTSLEDELIASFDIGSVPDAFYNISVTTTKERYTWS